MNIRDSIRLLADTGAEMFCKVCTVDSVNKAARTVDCTPLDEGSPLLGVNLQANQESDIGIVVYPKPGSYVIAGFLNNNSAAVLLCDEIESAELIIGRTKIVVNDGHIVMNGGNLGGLIKIEALTGALNDFISAFNNHTHVLDIGAVVVSGNATTQSNTAPLTVPDITNKKRDFNREDYEDNTVTH